ncbi:hypothetical protein VB715_20335 [Crocosphaera sp. UHCC 0190]|uniref:hypothetical protein n=1 Tax=Crocosphaera sp. UHCC 0190 TaxID=3110246 RepID=UPI002B1F4D6C|nr:hypothetical protein [Crocosphaera sp. UHCC 0190]MEA5512126.1 hypothetical protein [Crocosphaera sp. UHCC 0190]
MNLNQLIPSLEKLSPQDKLKAIQFLAKQLEQDDEQNLSSLTENKTYEVWSPYDAFSAEAVLTEMLEKHSQGLNKDSNHD